LREAFSIDGPVLVEAAVDPHEPPLPPKIKMKQIAHLAEALMRGTPAREKIALNIASNAIRELV
jgi:pyruvate dehydrogenase (quinone)